MRREQQSKFRNAFKTLRKDISRWNNLDSCFGVDESEGGYWWITKDEHGPAIHPLDWKHRLKMLADIAMVSVDDPDKLGESLQAHVDRGEELFSRLYGMYAKIPNTGFAGEDMEDIWPDLISAVGDVQMGLVTIRALFPFISEPCINQSDSEKEDEEDLEEEGGEGEDDGDEDEEEEEEEGDEGDDDGDEDEEDNNDEEEEEGGEGDEDDDEA